MDFIQWVTERTPDPGWAFFWVYRTHRNIKSSGSSKIHWIWYLAFSKIWQNEDTKNTHVPFVNKNSNDVSSISSFPPKTQHKWYQIVACTQLMILMIYVIDNYVLQSVRVNFLSIMTIYRQLSPNALHSKHLITAHTDQRLLGWSSTNYICIIYVYIWKQKYVKYMSRHSR